MARPGGNPKNWCVGRMATAVCFALAAVFATPHMLRTSDTLFYTNSVLALVLFVLYTGLFYQLPVWATKRRLSFTAPLGLAFSGMMVFGAALETAGDVAFGQLSTWLAVLGGAPLFCALLTLLWHALDRRGPGGKAVSGPRKNSRDGTSDSVDSPGARPSITAGKLERLSARLGRWPLHWRTEQTAGPSAV